MLRKSLLYSLVYFTSLILNAQELDVVKIDKIAESTHLAKKAILLKDSDEQYEVEDILEGNASELDFEKIESDVPYMDFTSATYWMKLKVENSSNQEQKIYIELARPLTNIVDLFLFDENNTLSDKFEAGDDLPFKNRPYLHRKFIFPVSFPANSERTLVIKTKSDGEILELPIKFWTIEDFTQFNSLENFFLGFYYGFLALVFILFSFFGYALKQKLYLFFVGYVFVLGLFQFSLDGFAYQFLWSNSPWMGNHAILIFAALSMLALLSYADQFLELNKLKKWYYSIFKVFYLLTSIGFLTSFLSGTIYAISFPVLNGLSFLFICYFFIGIYLKYKAGHKIEAPIALAFVFLWLGAIFFVLCNVNIIENEFLAANALKLGSAGEITLLSIAMAGRYRQTQADKIEAQEKAFNRLEEINELKDQQTEKLERQVKERTVEISEKNKTLTVQNEEIINSINYAKRLQTAILPSKKLLEAVFKESSILYLPKDIVSGDFYWVESTKTHTFFAVADCTGHGVPGALVSVVGHNALNRCVNEMGLTEPGKILDRLRDLVEFTFKNDENEVSDGMDICLCVWDNKSTLQFAGAFNSLYHIRELELTEIKGNKQPIGKFILKEDFITHTVQLKEGDSVFLFSDGYPDQFGGEKGKKLKYSVFKKYLLEVNNLDVKDVEKQLRQKFIDWQRDEEQVDDVCILNVRF